MPSDIKIRFGKTRGTPEHYFTSKSAWMADTALPTLSL